MRTDCTSTSTRSNMGRRDMEKNRFFGVGEPLIQRQRDQGIDAAAYLALVAGLGCTAFRSWMHITEILDDPSTPNPEAVAMHTKLLNQAADKLQKSTGLMTAKEKAPTTGLENRKHRRLRRHRAQTHGREMT